MTPTVIREESPTDHKEQLEALRPASTRATINRQAWEDAVHGDTGDSSELFWRSTYAKGGRRWSPSRLRRGVFWVFLSVLIPALIISVLRAVCRASASASTGQTAGVSIRRLSDSDEGSREESTPSQLIEECAALEAELGVALTEESNPAPALDAEEQVARIAHSLFLEGLAFEMQHTQQALDPNFFNPLMPSPASSGLRDQHHPAHGTVHMPDQEYGYPGPLHLTSDLAASHLQPGGLPPQTFALDSPHALGGASQPALSETQPFSAVPSHFPWTPHGASASLHTGVAAPQSVGLFSDTAPLPLQGGAQRSSKERRHARISRKPYPALDPDSWLEGIPAVNVSPQGQSPSQPSSPQGVSPDQAAPCSSAACQVSAGESEGATTGESSSEASPAGADEAAATAAGAGSASELSAAAGAPASAAASPQPELIRAHEISSAASVVVPSEASTAGAAAGAASEASAAAESPAEAATRLQADWICKHPFVRLPVLQEGVDPPPIQLSASNFASTKVPSVAGTFVTLRFLFMKQALNQREANFLVEYVQELAIASAARARATKRTSRPKDGAANIGRQFLALDAIVSAMHVLGVPPLSCTWWEKFSECFDTNYRYTQPGIRTRECGMLNIDLANRMLAAMSIYKAGKRPNLEEIIDLKRLLFLSPYAPLSFSNPKWDPWRADFLTFERKNHEISEWLRRRRHTC